MPPEKIIVVMGPTGAGKSNFIHVATGQNGNGVGHGLQSRTEQVHCIKTVDPNDGQPVVFVDTPGFNDTSKSDVVILGEIASWLQEAYGQNAHLSAVIYLHKISDNRMAKSALNNLRFFSTLCDPDAMKKAVFVTTMWSEVPRELGIRREQELKTKFLRKLLAGGCRFESFGDTYKSAWDIIRDPERDWTRATNQQRTENPQQRALELGRRVEVVQKGLRQDAKKERKCVVQ